MFYNVEECIEDFNSNEYHKLNKHDKDFINDILKLGMKYGVSLMSRSMYELTHDNISTEEEKIDLAARMLFNELD